MLDVGTLGVDEKRFDERTEGVGVVDDFPPSGVDESDELIEGVVVVVVVVVLGKDVKGEKGGGAAVAVVEVTVG